MTANSRQPNQGLAANVRRGSMTFPVPQPIENMPIPLVMVAEFEFRILRIWHRTQDGDCEVEFFIDNELVELDTAAVGGELVVDEGAAEEATPDSTDVNNYTVHEGDRLDMIVDNISTILVGLEIQVDYEKTDAAANDDD